MPVVTGTLADFGLVPLAPYAPQLVWLPSGNAITTGSSTFLLSTKPRVTIPAADGSWTVNLVQTDILVGISDPHYKLRIEWLDPDNPSASPSGFEVPNWKIYVPAAGGKISDLIAAPWNPILAWVGETPPPGRGTPNTLWLNPVTGDLMRWSN